MLCTVCVTDYTNYSGEGLGACATNKSGNVYSGSGNEWRSSSVRDRVVLVATGVGGHLSAGKEVLIMAVVAGVLGVLCAAMFSRLKTLRGPEGEGEGGA